MTPEDFQQHWRTGHAQLAMELMTHMDRYWQNHRILDCRAAAQLPWPGFDACSEIDSPTVTTHLAMRTSAAFFARAAQEDPKILDESKAGAVWARRISSEGNVRQGVRLLTFMRRAPMNDQATLAATLLDSPAAEHATGREVFMSLTGPEAQQVCSVFDAIEGLWFPDSDAASRYLGSTAAEEDTWHLAGIVRGRERVLARVEVMV
jgi:EthD domain